MMLGDEQWGALKAALDAVRPGTGRPLADERRTIEGVVWRLRNGARWRAIPAEYRPWWRPARLHVRWSKAGLWARLFALLRDAGRPELADVFMDGTVIRAHHGRRWRPRPCRSRGTPELRSVAAGNSSESRTGSPPQVGMLGPTNRRGRLLPA